MKTITIREAAEQLGCTVSNVRKMIRNGTITTVPPPTGEGCAISQADIKAIQKRRAAEARYLRTDVFAHYAGITREQALSVRKKVFLGSLMDIFEDWPGPMVDVHGEELYDDLDGGFTEAQFGYGDIPLPGQSRITMQDVRNRVFSLIDRTPNLTWLLLTKRPENALRMIPLSPAGRENLDNGNPTIGPNAAFHLLWRPNVWIGYSASTQEDLDRGLPHLLKVPAAVRFLSIEPLLGPVEFSDVTNRSDAVERWGRKALDGIGWVIVGCESGPNRRPMRTEWAASIADQCKAAGVPFFMKQMEVNGKVTGDISLFPNELQRREVPV